MSNLPAHEIKFINGTIGILNEQLLDIDDKLADLEKTIPNELLREYRNLIKRAVETQDLIKRLTLRLNS